MKHYKINLCHHVNYVRYIFNQSQVCFWSFFWSNQIQVWIHHCMKFNVFKCSDEWHDFLWLQKLKCKWCLLNFYNLACDDEWLIIWRWCKTSLCMSEKCVDFFNTFLFKVSLIEEQSLNYNDQTADNIICFKVIKHKWVNVVQKRC